MNVADPTINALSLCSGYAGLDIGFEAACEHLGISARTVAYVEWEAYAAALLIRRMETQCLAPAPVWCGDLGRLNGTDFRGRVDAVLAGFPCQPHSHAGSRKGVEDERWIWPDIARIVRESGAWLVVLENVAGLLSSGGFAPVLTDLAALGFDAEWGVLSAGSVGASHRRERVFIVAYRHDGFSKWQRADRGESAAGTNGRGHDRGDCGAVADTSGAQGWRSGAGREPIGRSAACGPVDAVDNTDSLGAERPGRKESRSDSGCEELAQLGCGELFAPGPSDPRWPGTLAERPDLAPATEPGVRLLADGPPVSVDQHRAHQLRCGGNGVVPLQAAVGIVTLLRRLGIAE